jgi:hypothetical protein
MRENEFVFNMRAVKDGGSGMIQGLKYLDVKIFKLVSLLSKFLWKM